MQPTRLNRFKEKKTKQQLIVRLGGSIALIFVLIKWGIPALISLSLFLGSFHSAAPAPAASQTKTYLSAPFLTPSFSATNSASISVSGTATPKAEVRLFINSTYSDSVTAKDDGTFTFTTVSLSDGQNTIQTKAKTDKAESDFSAPLTISYLHTAPKLDVSSPHDGDSFDKNTDTTTIKGMTDPQGMVTINGYRAIVDDSGAFSYTYTLKSGDNSLTIDAVDAAGNKTEKTLTIKSQK